MNQPDKTGYYMLRPSGADPRLNIPQPIYYIRETNEFRLLAVTSAPLTARIPWDRLKRIPGYDAWAPIKIGENDWQPL